MSYISWRGTRLGMAAVVIAAGLTAGFAAAGEDRDDTWRGEDPREMVETVLMARLAKALELSEEETVMVVQRFQDYRSELHAMVREHQDLVRSLRENLREEDPDEGEIEERLEAVIEQEKAIANHRHETFKAVGEDLTSLQQARLYVFMQDFDADMRRLIHRARESWRERERDSGDGRRDESRGGDAYERENRSSNEGGEENAWLDPMTLAYLDSENNMVLETDLNRCETQALAALLADCALGRKRQ